MEWVNTHWGTIAIILAAVVQIVNRMTKHWTEATSKPAKVGLLLTEIASVLTSKRASTRAGILKFPLQSVRPKQVVAK